MFEIKDYENKMKNTVNNYSEALTMIRAGRANPKLVEGITFEYYGVETPINQAATINVPEAMLITIQPWDVNNLKPIEKAILESDLGITPNNDGKILRLPFPALTEERRKELVKDVNAKAEESKISIRNIRRDAMDELKKAEKANELTEDDRFSLEEDVQKLTDKYIGEIESVAKDKEKELMEI